MPHRQNKKKHIEAKTHLMDGNATTTGQGIPLSREEFEYYVGKLRGQPILASDIAGEARGIRAYCSPTLNRMYTWAISSMDTSNVTITVSVS